jgi:hypothetical protein
MVLAIVIAVSIGLAALPTFLLWWGQTGPQADPLATAQLSEQVAPGTVGCRSTPGNICYSFAIVTLCRGVTLSHLSFQVANGSYPISNLGSEGPPIPLGAGAQVSVLSSSSTVVGTWNYSSKAWSTGSNWALPVNVDVTMIMDTGLFSNSTLVNGAIEVVLSGPQDLAVGTGGLAWAACRYSPSGC